MSFVGRKTLPHHSPSWVDPAASDYFVTINCQRRGTNQFCLPTIGEELLKSARVYYDQRKWFPALFLLMPDHLHMLVSFGRDQDMSKVVISWKRYVATKYQVGWQRGFFEHRLRGAEILDEKAAYILQNPVRAGLVRAVSEWQYVMMLD